MTISEALKNGKWQIDILVDMLKNQDDEVVSKDLNAIDLTELNLLWSDLLTWFKSEFVDSCNPKNFLKSGKTICYFIKIYISSNPDLIPNELLQLVDLFCEEKNLEKSSDTYLMDLVLQLYDFSLANNITLSKNLKSSMIRYITNKCLVNTKAFKTFEKMKDIFEEVDSSHFENVFMNNANLQRFVYNKQGQECIAILLTLNNALPLMIHDQLKGLIMSTVKSKLQHIAHLYYWAWSIAKKDDLPSLKVIENDMLQDLIKMGYLLKKPKAIHIVLSYLHKEKLQSDLFYSTLHYLYDPFLYPHLKAANYLVRKNAAIIFCNLFPFVDKNQNKISRDEAIEKQIVILQNLLEDPSVEVGTVAVHGILDSMKTFLDRFNISTQKNMFNKIINNFLTSSEANTRTMIIIGLSNLLDNTESHGLLKFVLPKLRLYIYDVSESVRIAMIDLLIKIKCVQNFKITEIVSKEEILSQLCVERGAALAKLVLFLKDQFMSPEMAAHEMLAACLQLIRINRKAARAFYSSVEKYLDLAPTLGFILKSLGFMSYMVVKNNMEFDLANSLNESINKANEEPVSDFDLSDVPLVSGLCELTAILFKAILSQLELESNKKLQYITLKEISSLLTILIKGFTNPHILSPLFLMASYLSPKSMQAVSTSLMSNLRKLPEDSEIDTYACYLFLAVNWKKTADILDLVASWLAEVIGDHTLEDFTITRKRNNCGVRFVEPAANVILKPKLGLKYLDYLFDQEILSPLIIQNHYDYLINFVKILEPSMMEIDKILNGKKCNTDYFLLLCHVLEKYIVISVLLLKSDKDAINEKLTDFLNWFVRIILPHYDNTNLAGNNNKKRRNNSIASLIDAIVQVFFTITQGTLQVFFVNQTTANLIVQICLSLLKKAELSTFEGVVKCSRNLLEWNDQEENVSSLEPNKEDAWENGMSELLEGVVGKARERGEDIFLEENIKLKESLSHLFNFIFSNSMNKFWSQLVVKKLIEILKNDFKDSETSKNDSNSKSNYFCDFLLKILGSQKKATRNFMKTLCQICFKNDPFADKEHFSVFKSIMQYFCKDEICRSIIMNSVKMQAKYSGLDFNNLYANLTQLDNN